MLLQSWLVGGMASYGLCFRTNMSNLASLTLSTVLDLSYIMTTNLSKGCRSSSPTSGYWLSFLKTSEVSSKASHGFKVDSISLPRNAETTSKPVKAWRASLCSFLLDCYTSHEQESTSSFALGRRQSIVDLLDASDACLAAQIYACQLLHDYTVLNQPGWKDSCWHHLFLGHNDYIWCIHRFNDRVSKKAE